MVHFILYSKIFEAILYQWDSNSELAMFESLVLTFCRYVEHWFHLHLGGIISLLQEPRVEIQVSLHIVFWFCIIISTTVWCWQLQY